MHPLSAFSRVGAATAVGVAALAAACTSSGESDSDAAEPPVIEDVVVTPNPNSTLSAIVELTTDVPAAAAVIVSGPEGEHTIRSPDGTATTHELPVVGMRAETEYELVIEASTGDDDAEATTTAQAIATTSAASPTQRRCWSSSESSSDSARDT